MNKVNNSRTPSIEDAVGILLQYKRQKRELETRLAMEENVWRNVYSGGEPSSWIFSSIVNKHADIIDNMTGYVSSAVTLRDS